MGPRRGSVARAGALLLALALCAGCRTGRNYPEAAGPRYAGAGTDAPAAVPPLAGDTLRVVSFNVAHAAHIDAALALLAARPELRGADIVLLQEMDDSGARRMARALGMAYVYYPAIYHLSTRRDFGNAVLSRWPIVEDAKIILPHTGVLSRTRRTATAATILVGDERVRVYSAHLATPAEVVTPGGRRAQLRAILEDAARYPRALVGGDMNGAGVGRVAQEEGFVWATELIPRTAPLGRLDHFFLRGLDLPEGAAAGTVPDAGKASDHRPIWLRALVRRAPPPMARAYAHNDYEHERPLLDALEHGFNAVEPDVHLVRGELLVGHDSADLRPGRTLQRLYLDPLRAWIGAHGGQVQPGLGPMLLLVDLKSAPEPTYLALDSLLCGYADILTRYQDGRVLTGPVRVVVSGNRPRALMAAQPARLAAYDGRLADLRGRTAPAGFMPLVSDEWKRVSAWKGVGTFPEGDRRALNRAVAAAHAQGRAIRFWGAPDMPAVWQVQYEAGVDYINTDSLAALGAFLLRR